MEPSSTNTRQILRAYLAQQGDVRLAYLFGSFARGLERAESDVDLAVLTEGPLSTQRKMALVEEVAELTGRAVDLIDLATVGEPLLGEILGGLRLAGDTRLHAELISRHVTDVEDFLPSRERILLERRKAWIGA